jgi:hypothetical protein
LVYSLTVANTPATYSVPEPRLKRSKISGLISGLRASGALMLAYRESEPVPVM